MNWRVPISQPHRSACIRPPQGRTGDETVGAQRRIVALQEEVTQIEKEKLDLSTQVRTLERQLQVPGLGGALAAAHARRIFWGNRGQPGRS